MDDSGTHVDERFSEPFWNERYGSAGRIWSGQPNPQLVREAAYLPPGHALDAGCGEGADARWLARRGWRVTATDISTVALERAAEHTEPEIADRITWRRADLLALTADPQRYDLVSAQFLHFPSSRRGAVFGALAESVAPGGTLLVVGHDLSDPRTTKPRPAEPDLYYTAEQLAGTLAPDRWGIVVAQARPRAVVHGGRNETIVDAVLRARRRDDGADG